jgi:hypothetical protein
MTETMKITVLQNVTLVWCVCTDIAQKLAASVFRTDGERRVSLKSQYIQHSSKTGEVRGGFNSSC